MAGKIPIFELFPTAFRLSDFFRFLNFFPITSRFSNFLLDLKFLSISLWFNYNQGCRIFKNRNFTIVVDVLAIVPSRFLAFLVNQPRFFFILEIMQESFRDLTARNLPDFQEYKILDRTDKS